MEEVWETPWMEVVWIILVHIQKILEWVLWVLQLRSQIKECQEGVKEALNHNKILWSRESIQCQQEMLEIMLIMAISSRKQHGKKECQTFQGIVHTKAPSHLERMVLWWRMNSHILLISKLLHKWDQIPLSKLPRTMIMTFKEETRKIHRLKHKW